MYDLVIIGGGPAGTAAAIAAARGGASVLLLEGGSFPRPKVCGEFVSAESLDLLAELLTPEDSKLLSSAARIARGRMLMDGRTVETPIRPAAASISRYELDAALWRSTEKAGIDARQQTTVSSISGDGPFDLQTSSGVFQGRAIIDASGRWSKLSVAHAQHNKSADKWIGLKAHFIEDAPAPSVDLYFFEGGYCGVQPLSSSQVNVCAMVRAEVASKLEHIFAHHPLLHKRSAKWRFATQSVSTAQLVFRKPQPTRGNQVLAGDAAGFVDPFVGDGISLALRSGTLAATTLGPFFRREATLAKRVKKYKEQYDNQLAYIFRSASWIRKALRMPQVVRRPVSAVLEKSPVLAEFLLKATR